MDAYPATRAQAQQRQLCFKFWPPLRRGTDWVCGVLVADREELRQLW